MRRVGIEAEALGVLWQAQLVDAQPVQRTQVAQTAQGEQGHRVEDVGGQSVARQQGRCSGARGSKQACGVVVREECVEEGQDEPQSVEQWRVGQCEGGWCWLAALQRLRAVVLMAVVSLHRCDERASEEE